jgi:hypothetical protein
MIRAPLRFVLPALVLLATAPAAQAQTRCAYAECALRVKSAGFTTPPAVVRGAQDSVLVTLQWFGPRVAPVFQQSDSAYYHALRYDSFSRRATILNIAGPLAFIVGSLFTNWSEKPVASSLMMGSALAITVYGGHMTNVSNDELSRAVWWYNRELVERGYPPAPGR